MTVGAEIRWFLCPSGKQVYGQLASALYHAARAERTTGKPFRVYQCPSCGYFHLTSHAKVHR